MSARRSSALRSGRRSAAPRLKDRRREKRRRTLIISLVLALLLLGSVFYALWQPDLRISAIEVRGADTLLPGPSPVDLAKAAMHGSYLGILPRDSALFFPEHRIRLSVIGAHPEIAALSFAHDGLTGLVIRASMRTAVGRWCGLAPSPGVAAYCYYYDPGGYVFAALPDPLALDASSTVQAATGTMQTLDPFTLYAPLVGDGQEPLRATIAHADELPDAFAFARQLADFGSAAESVVVRGDEADILLASGTRVTYVLGHEVDAYSALLSARNNLNLADGSLEYVDLRFSGKVYLKKKE